MDAVLQKDEQEEEEGRIRDTNIARVARWVRSVYGYLAARCSSCLLACIRKEWEVKRGSEKWLARCAGDEVCLTSYFYCKCYEASRPSKKKREK